MEVHSALRVGGGGEDRALVFTKDFDQWGRYDEWSFATSSFALRRSRSLATPRSHDDAVSPPHFRAEVAKTG
jgi:hypothetical protein